MKNFLSSFAVCLFLIAFSGVIALAQEKEAPPMFFVIEEFVAPSDLNEFKKVQSEAVKLFDEIDLKMTFSCYRTDQNSFYWVVPIENFAGIDKLHAQIKSNNKAFMDKGYNPAEKFRNLSTMSQFVVLWDKDLSYHPNPANEDEAPHKFHEWSFVYLKSGHEKEAGEAIKAYQKFYDGVEESFSWSIYPVAMGENMPCWILHVSAESEIALRKQEKVLMEKYGKEFEKMWSEFAVHILDSKTVKGWSLPIWSRGE